MSLVERAPAPTAPPTPSNRRAAIALAVIVTCQLMIVLDVTVVNIALTKIHADLHFSSAGLSWVIDAYTLTFGGLMLLGGRAGDIFGRRRLLVLGVALFSVSSLAGGLATSSGLLVAARAIQGVGAAMAAPSTLALIAATFEEGPARNRALGLFTAVSAGGGSLGLLLGGALTSYASWRWVLFINVPIGLAVVLLAPRVVVEPPTRKGRLDLPGAVLSTAGLAGLIYGFIRIGAHDTAPLTIASFVAGAVLLLGFLVVEKRSTSPLMPLRLLTERTRGTAYAQMLLVPAAMFGMFFFTSQFIEGGLHYSAVKTGLAFLPLTGVIFSLSRIMPRVLARTGARPWIFVGTAFITGGLAWLSQASASSGYWAGLFGPLTLFGLGAGLCFLPLAATILAGVAQDDAGSASGLLQAMQQVGGSVGVAVLVSVASAHGQKAALLVAAGFTAVAFVLGIVGRPVRSSTVLSEEELEVDAAAEALVG